MSKSREAGAALIVALIMLLISTMIGLASIRSTATSERMAANMYDRSLAYQAAEAALRAGELAVEADSVTAIDCTLNNADCPPTPVSTFNPANSTGWTLSGNGFAVNNELMSSASSYYVEKMGEVGGTDEFGLTDSANCANYAGCDQTAPTAALYRITGRSLIGGNDGDGRSVVALQITVKQNL